MMRDPSVIQRLENYKVKSETSIRGSEGKMQIREKRLQNSVGIVKSKQTNKNITLCKVKVVIFSPSLVSLKSKERLSRI